MKHAGRNVARHNRWMALAIGERNFPKIQSQIIDALLRIRAMTGKAVVCKNRADVPIEVDPPDVFHATGL
jgi:hypothetical protein